MTLPLGRSWKERANLVAAAAAAAGAAAAVAAAASIKVRDCI